MRNVLLLHPDLLFYKVRIYNKLSLYLRERGHRLIVWPTGIDTQGERMQFDRIEMPMSIAAYAEVLRGRKIDMVINYLSRRSVSVPFYVAAAIMAKMGRRRFVYYGHGLKLSRKDNVLEILLSNLYLLLCDRIILFSPGEERYLWNCHQRRAVVACNTLDMGGARSQVRRSRAQICQAYGIVQSRLVLFSGRIWPRKRLELLVRCFLENGQALKDVGLVIVGSGMPQQLRESIRGSAQVYSLGPVCDREQIAELFSIADVFCIPGSMGLGIVEAFHWGIPVVTLNVQHGPEGYYLKNGKNCVIVDQEEDLAGALASLLSDGARRARMGREARATFEQEASLERMFTGFYEGIRLAFAEPSRDVAGSVQTVP